MWWSETRVLVRALRLAIVLSSAGLTAACFQPLYGERSFEGSGPGLREKFASVDVLPIDAPGGSPAARLGVEVRNDVVFALQGGNGRNSPTHALKISLVPTSSSIIVDIHTARPDVENYGVNATYTLVELATGKQVVSASTFSRVSYDIPGQEQRFARARAQRDAENRAAKVIADHIQARLASYFVAGT
ncbi:MAG TPA: LPS assembly lipoprotein LptE [Xanthobacteraceae bacterium]|jgi:LPS-assembly lipoprotein